MQANTMKTLAALFGSALILSAIYVSPSSAADAGGGGDSGGGSGVSEGYLRVIAENTTNILQRVNNFPGYITKMLELAENLQKKDDSTATTQLQQQFGLTAQAIATDANNQKSYLGALDKAQLGDDATTLSLPGANDLLYSTLLGQLFFNPDPRIPPGTVNPSLDPAYNYIRYASANNVTHAIPANNWRGTGLAITRYTNYYNTVNAVQSYSAFLLSSTLAEAKSGNKLTTAQMALVAQASDASWLSTIASEEIGKVLRQLLMFESQTYVLMTQILQTQKQMLTAQAMTMGLMIAAAQGDEKSLLKDAQG